MCVCVCNMCWISAEFLVANYNRPNHNNPGHNDHIWTMPYCRSFNDSKGVPWQQGWHWTSALMPSDAGRRLTRSANLRRLWLSPLPTDLYWEHRTALAELATRLQQSALDCTWNTIKQPTIYCFTATIQVNQRSPAPPVRNWRVLLVQPHLRTGGFCWIIFIVYKCIWIIRCQNHRNSTTLQNDT